MGRCIAILQPKNFAPETQRFREGLVRVDDSYFTTLQPEPFGKEEARAPYVALIWEVTRLGEDMQPQIEDEKVVTEQLIFGVGGKSLGSVHPANASSPEDEDLEDLGTQPGVKGPTLNQLRDDVHFQLNSKSGLAWLTASLSKAGYNPAFLARVWAPDFKGGVFHLKTQLSDEKMAGRDGVERPIAYKVVDKVIGATAKSGASVPKGRGKAKEAASGAAPATNGSGKDPEAEAVLDPILTQVADSLAGQSVTRKTLKSKVNSAMASTAVPAGLQVRVGNLLSEEQWILAHQGKYEYVYSVSDGNVSFSKAA